MPIICPVCSYSRSWTVRRSKRKCKRCRHEFSSNIYPVRGIRSTINDWQKCIHIFIRQRAILTISKETGISHCRIAMMVDILRQCMANDIPERFNGPVELDETYIGGQRKNKCLHIRRIKGKRGHGTDKLPIMGIFDRSSRQIYTEVMPVKLSMAHLFRITKAKLIPGTLIITDGYKMYRGFKTKGFKHEYVDHDGGEYARGEIHTNNIEGFWGILKRKLGCIGGMRRNKLYLFVAEIGWEFNHKSLTYQQQEKLLLDLVIKFGGLIQ
jgi:transposase-like protein